MGGWLPWLPLAREPPGDAAFLYCRSQLLPAGPLCTALSVSEAGRHSLLSPPAAGCGMEALPLPKATASPRLVSQRPAYTLVNGLY